jgi:hypothetical protein
MSRGRRVQAESAAETQAASRAERVAKWLQVPLIVAALLANLRPEEQHRAAAA